MRFSVPQYINIEDKLYLGAVSFTYAQLFLIFFAFLISYGAFKLLPTLFALLITILSVVLAVLLGWGRINNKSVLGYLPNLIQVLFSSKKYFWREEVKIVTRYVNVPTIEKYLELLEEEVPEKKIEKKVEQGIVLENPLSEYINNAHKHGYNPYDPYINFPIPKFPKRRW
jgi:flagellar motor component MotA